MSKVCVVTGGSGMGLSAAKFMPKDRIIVVSGRTESKLTKAVEQLREAGFEAYAKACDTSKRDSVKALAEYACRIHIAMAQRHIGVFARHNRDRFDEFQLIVHISLAYADREILDVDFS